MVCCFVKLSWKSFVIGTDRMVRCAVLEVTKNTANNCIACITTDILCCTSSVATEDHKLVTAQQNPDP
jgi:hypothetical protein